MTSAGAHLVVATTKTYISDAVNPLPFEFAIVELLNSSLQVTSSLKFDKALEYEVSMAKLSS